ncbi:DUF6126 family protein [Streptomyces sp. NPDC086989]|uniref:DUF6126 family protein n=1 Tax=Streptomyces sp. NPDC086989 TaxID=3365764 RepID=UPI0038238B9A
MTSNSGGAAQLYEITCLGAGPEPEARTVEAGYQEGRRSMTDDLPEKDTASEHEKWKEKGVAMRAFFYIFGTHVFAGFIWLLFYLGQHAQK